MSAQPAPPQPSFENADHVWSAPSPVGAALEQALAAASASPSVTLTLELSAPKLQLGFHAPAVTAPELIALECLDELLLGHDSARLHRALIFDAERASDVYSAVPQFRGDGLYEIGVDLLPGQDPLMVRAEILCELARVARGELDEAELRRAQLSRELMTYLELQTLQQRAQALGFWATVTRDTSTLFERHARFAQVTLADVQRVAGALLRPAGIVTVIGAPDERDLDHAKGEI